MAKILPMPRRPQKIDSLAAIRAWREHCGERRLHGSGSSAAVGMAETEAAHAAQVEAVRASVEAAVAALGNGLARRGLSRSRRYRRGTSGRN
jgi:hypothetical protein